MLIKRSDLPPAVEKTVSEQSASALTKNAKLAAYEAHVRTGPDGQSLD